jgi:serine/threonine protein kinase
MCTFGVAFSNTCAACAPPPTPPPLTWQVLCVSSVKPDGSLSVSAKISDFGLALRAMPLPTGRGWGTVTAQPRGTPAYMAPEMLGQRDGQGCVEVGPMKAEVCRHACQEGWLCWDDVFLLLLDPAGRC